MNFKKPPAGVHVTGTNRGEELVAQHGREAGRDERGKQGYRAARDSTSVNPQGVAPIDSRMPEMPPS